MKFKKDSNLQNNDQSVNKKIAEMLLSNLLKGKSIRDDAAGVSDTNDDSSNVINDNNEKHSISVKQKSYSIDKNSSMASTSSSSSNIRDFLKESNELDNEINQMISSLNINHADDIYNNVIDKKRNTNKYRNRDDDDDDDDDDESYDDDFENDENDVELEGGLIDHDELNTITQSYLNDQTHDELKELYERIDKEIAKSIKEVKTMRRLYNPNYNEADFLALVKVLEKEKETKKLVKKSSQTLNKIRQNYSQLYTPFNNAFDFEYDGKISINDMQQEIVDMRKALETKHDANKFIKTYSNYKNLSKNDKKTVDSVFVENNPLFTKEQLYDAMIKNGFVVTRTMDRLKYDKDGEIEPISDVMRNLSKKDLYRDFVNNQKSGGRNQMLIINENSVSENLNAGIVKKIL
jgi:hypothetical protein